MPDSLTDHAPADDFASEGASAEMTAPALPPDVPEKFRDPDSGAVRVEALMQSYRELERKLGTMVPLPGDDPADAARLRAALGVPEQAEDYAIETRAGVFESDPAINARLHEAGFTRNQAQLVYDLADEVVLPLIVEAAAEFEAERQTDALQRHFGADRWPEVARQIAAWGSASLPAEVFEALSATREGVIAMHRMMEKGEPALVGGGGTQGASADEDALGEMMRDPRYWRDRDPGLVRRVRAGFRALYPGEA